MAGKVNTKFVVILSVSMVLLFGAALALTFWIKGRSPEDLMKQGDAKMAAKDYEGAERAYSKAVFKEQTNAKYHEKWLSVLEAWIPETQTQYVQQYQKYVGEKRVLARLKATDVKAHREFLDLLYVPFTSERYNNATAQQIVSETERTLGVLKGTPTEQGEGRVLRRYRGMVRVRTLGEPGFDVPADQREQAKGDLEAALAADPQDAPSAVALMNWHLNQAEPLKRSGKEAEAQVFLDAGHKVLDDFLSANPQSPEGLVTKLLMDLDTAQRAVPTTLAPREHFDAIRAAFDGLLPRLEAMNEAFTKAPPASLGSNILTQFRMCEQYINPAARSSRTSAILERLLKEKPDDAPTMIAMAQVMADRGDLDGGIAQLEKIVALPKKPVGSEGIRLFTHKAEALFTQVSLIFQKWEQAPDESGKSALLEQAKKLRPTMVQLTAEESMPVLYIDAMSTFASGDALAARQLLTKFNEATGKSNISTLWAQAQTELKLNNMGTARELLDNLVQRRGDLPAPHVLIAQIDFQLKNTDAALKRLDAVLQSDKEYAPAKKLLEQIKVATGVTESNDPGATILSRADRALQGDDKELPDVPGALAILQEAVKTMPDPRLFYALANLQMQLGDKPGATATVAAGLKANPDNADLKLVLTGLTQADPVKWQLEQIDLSKAGDLDKLLQKSSLLTSVSRFEEAGAMLAQAAKLAPDDARVLDRQFLSALRLKNYELAAKVVEQAGAKNTDRANGALYRGRLLATQGRNPEAILALEEARKNGAADVGSIRLLGRLYTQGGRFEDADLAFREALRQRPDDVATIVDQITALRAAGREGDALNRARENERMARGNREFTELLYTLESKVGNRAGILALREKLLTREPTNLKNKLELARLYLEGRRWEDSQALLDQLKTQDTDRVAVAQLGALLHVNRGDPAAAQAVLEEAIKAIDPKQISSRPFMLFGQFLADHSLYNEAVAMLERGRAYQSPTEMECDRSLGDMLSTAGRTDLAVGYYARVVDGKADGPNQEVRLRLVEMLSNLDKWDEAAKYLEGISVGARNDPVLALLRADVAAGKGDDKHAREIFDKAITDFAQEPLVYFRRAQFFLRKTPPMTTEALQDLGAALKVRPSYWQARRTRALVYVTQGKRDEAIDDLREAIRSNPALDDMRLSLMRELIGMDRASQAAEMADEALKARPNDANLAIGLSTVFLNAQDWPRGQQYARQAWELNKLNPTPDIALAYLEALLNSEPKNVTDAEAVLREKMISEAIPQSSGLLLARAKVLAFRGRAPDAAKDIMASMGVLKLDQPALVQQWWLDVRRVLTKPEEAIKVLERRDIPARFVDWAAFLRASMYADNQQTRLGSAKAFEEITKNAKDQGLVQFSFRAWGTALYQEAKYEEASQVWLAGLGKFAEDPEMLNNLSYVMARYLKKPQDAIPFAERAVAATGNGADALDTLGYCYMVTGRLEDADKTMRQALAVAKQVPQKVAVSLHQAELCVLRKEKDRAKTFIEYAESLLSKNPAFAPAYKAEVDEVRKQIDSL